MTVRFISGSALLANHFTLNTEIAARELAHVLVLVVLHEHLVFQVMFRVKFVMAVRVR